MCECVCECVNVSPLCVARVIIGESGKGFHYVFHIHTKNETRPASDTDKQFLKEKER